TFALRFHSPAVERGASRKSGPLTPRLPAGIRFEAREQSRCGLSQCFDSGVSGPVYEAGGRAGTENRRLYRSEIEPAGVWPYEQHTTQSLPATIRIRGR